MLFDKWQERFHRMVISELPVFFGLDVNNSSETFVNFGLAYRGLCNKHVSSLEGNMVLDFSSPFMWMSKKNLINFTRACLWDDHHRPCNSTDYGIWVLECKWSKQDLFLFTLMRVSCTNHVYDKAISRYQQWRWKTIKLLALTTSLRKHWSTQETCWSLRCMAYLWRSGRIRNSQVILKMPW